MAGSPEGPQLPRNQNPLLPLSVEQSQDAGALNPTQTPAVWLNLSFLAGEVDVLIILPLPGCVRTELNSCTPRGLFPDLPGENVTARLHPPPADLRAERQKVEEKDNSKGGSG